MKHWECPYCNAMLVYNDDAPEEPVENVKRHHVATLHPEEETRSGPGDNPQ